MLAAPAVRRCMPATSGGMLGLCGGDIPRTCSTGTGRHPTAELGGPSLVTNDAFIALVQRPVPGHRRGGDVRLMDKWLGINGRRMVMHDGHGHLASAAQAMRELFRVHEGYRAPSRLNRRLLRFTGFPSYAKCFNRQCTANDKRTDIRNTSPAQLMASADSGVLGARAVRGDREAVIVLGGTRTNWLRASARSWGGWDFSASRMIW